MGPFGCATPRLNVNRRRIVAFNQCQGSTISDPYAGAYASPSPVPVYNSASITSINRHGAIAGVCFPFVGNQMVQSSFIDAGGNTTMLLPTGAQSASGGFLNDDGRLAGSLVSGDGKHYDFIYHGGATMPLGVPFLAPIQVQAISDSGAVVGTFLGTQTSQQRVLVFTGAHVNVFGAFGMSDVVSVGINGKNELLVADAGAASTQSYRVTCSGTAC